MGLQPAPRRPEFESQLGLCLVLGRDIGQVPQLPLQPRGGWYRAARLLQAHRWAPSGLASGALAEWTAGFKPGFPPSSPVHTAPLPCLFMAPHCCQPWGLPWPGGASTPGCLNLSTADTLGHTIHCRGPTCALQESGSTSGPRPLGASSTPRRVVTTRHFPRHCQTLLGGHTRPQVRTTGHLTSSDCKAPDPGTQ